MLNFVMFLTRNPVVLIGLIIFIWAVRKAFSRPPDPRNDPPDPKNDWSNEDEMDRWL